MRLFIALPLTKEIEEALGKIIFVLKQKSGRVKWVAPKNIHLTVKFLGEVNENKIDSIKSSIQTIALKYQRVDCTIDAIGGFPNLSRPRVIWAGLTGQVQVLENIVHDVEEETFKLGFPKEEKRFTPHLTLGRIKENYGLDDLVSYIKTYQMESLNCPISTLSLFKSTLTPAGPIYDRLLEAELGK